MTAWLPVFEIFNVRTYYVQACDCTWGLYRHCRVCIGNCQGEKYPAASDFLSFIWKSSRLICSNTVYYHDYKYILKLSMHTHTEACTHTHTHKSFVKHTFIKATPPPPHTHTHTKQSVVKHTFIKATNLFCLTTKNLKLYLHVHYFSITISGSVHFVYMCVTFLSGSVYFIYMCITFLSGSTYFIFIYMCVTFLYYQAALNYIHLHVRYFSILSGSIYFIFILYSFTCALLFYTIRQHLLYIHFIFIYMGITFLYHQAAFTLNPSS